MLAPCPAVVGDDRIDLAPPQVVTVENAIYSPLSGAMDANRDWGVYEADGRLVEAAAYKRGPGRTLVGQSDFIEIPPGAAFVAGEMIYGGAVQGHYGHFLLGMLPRYWIDFAACPEHKILLHSNVSLDFAFTLPFIGEIFAALGLDRSRFVSFDRPVRIERLLVPEALFHETSVGKPAFATLCETIRTRLAPTVPRTRSAAYVSKARLKAGVWSVANEHLIAARLADRGVDIVYPELLPLPEQMNLFEQYETICGLMGSALHTSLFSHASNRIIALSHNPFVSSNYTLIDKLKTNRSTYVHCGDPMARLGKTEDFSCVFECPEPERVADDLFAMI